MRITNNPQPTPPAKPPLPAPTAPEAGNSPETPATPPNDTPPQEPKDGFAYTASRFTGSGVGGALGFSAGATVGAFKGLVQKEYDHQLAPGAVRITRVATAGVGAFFASQAGLALGGIPGAVVGAVAGGLAGGIAGGAVVGVGEGLLSVAHGAVDTGLKYGKVGSEWGGNLVDKAFGK